MDASHRQKHQEAVRRSGMKVIRLSLRNFRNVRESPFQPEPGLNFLIGANGQGKTSFLEALGFLATLRSFRGSSSEEVLCWGEDAAEIRCTLAPDPDDAEQGWETELRILFNKSGSPEKTSRVAFINGKPFKSSTSYLSQRFGNFVLGFHTVVFNPSDHDLVRGEPSIRRAYLDRVLAAENGDYLKIFQKYQRVVQQRNAILRTSERPDPDLISGFSEQMGKLAAAIAWQRLTWLKKLSERLNDTARRIAPNLPFLRPVYLSNWVPNIEGLSIPNHDLEAVHFAGLGPLPSLELLEQAFWNKLSVLEMAEWKSGHSLVGPHRDDWSFYFGNQALKGHGSQGEVRSALLALKLCEIELFRNETGHRPLFLLDDFSSELDRERRSFLLRFLSETDLQVFVTTTEDFSTMGKRFIVRNGSLVSHDVRPSQLNGS